MNCRLHVLLVPLRNHILHDSSVVDEKNFLLNLRVVECVGRLDQRLLSRVLPDHLVQHEVSRLEFLVDLDLIDGAIMHGRNELRTVMAFVSIFHWVEFCVVFFPLLDFTESFFYL